MIGWHTSKPTCINTACIEKNNSPCFCNRSFWTSLPRTAKLYGDIHVLHVRILILQLPYHGALTVDFMLYAGKWSKQVLTLSVYVTVLGLCVCLFVCLYLIEYYTLQGTLQGTTSSFRAMRARKRLKQLHSNQIPFFHIQSHIYVQRVSQSCTS